MIGNYLGAVSSAVGQGALTAVWVGSSALPKGRRRAVRAGASIAVMAYGWVTTSREDKAAVTGLFKRGDSDQAAVIELDSGTFRDLRAEQADEKAEDERPAMNGRQLAVLGVTTVGSLGMLIGRKRLEKRWLARLQRNGHPHPYRGLALRIGALAVAATLPGQLMEAYEKERGNRV